MSLALKQRVLRLATHPGVSAAFRRMVPLDKAVTRISGGRVHLVPDWFVPNLTLTTIGRRSGLPRSVPLLYVRDGDDYVIIGSNFGQDHHPAWSYNLESDPNAEIELGTRRIPVRATRLDDADRARLWPSIVAVWPAYENYVDWAGDRTIKLFRLTPRGDAS